MQRAGFGFAVYASRPRCSAPGGAGLALILALTAPLAAVTHRRQQLDHARARQLAEDRAEAQTRLIEDLSHELRTPIATMLTAAQGARATELAPRPVAEYLQWIEDSAQAGGRLVTRMPDLATLDRGRRPDPQPEALAVAVGAAVDGLHPLAASRSIELRLRTEAEPDRTVDAVSLGIVLRNLVINALDHSAPGTRVEVRLSARNGTARIDVEDRGEGIATEDLPHSGSVFSVILPSAPDRRSAGTLR